MVFVVVTIAGEIVLNNAVKGVVDRPRPTLSQLVTPIGSSFPSGHSAAAAAAYAAIAIVLARDRSPSVRRGMAIGAVTIAMVVAWSRVFLGVHWYSDVIGGLALGWGWCALCWIAVELSSVRLDAGPWAARRGRRADRYSGRVHHRSHQCTSGSRWCRRRPTGRGPRSPPVCQASSASAETSSPIERVDRIHQSFVVVLLEMLAEQGEPERPGEPACPVS